jgi:hypothetical protein
MGLCIRCGIEPIENKDTGLGAVCSAADRKAERQAVKDAIKGKPKPIARVSPKQQAINTKYSKSLHKRYAGLPAQKCQGCGEPATCTAHIIAKARLKVIGKEHLISDPRASFPSCYACNTAIENPKGQEWKGLANIEECLAFIEQHDKELFAKFTV